MGKNKSLWNAVFDYLMNPFNSQRQDCEDTEDSEKQKCGKWYAENCNDENDDFNSNLDGL